MTIKEAAAEIIEEFGWVDDWMDKYEIIIDMGKELPSIDDKHKVDENIVHGCQSQVWLIANMKDGKLVYEADSDAIISKGLIAMLIQVLSNQTPEDIVNADLSFLDTIGVREHLSPNRSNGLSSMLKQMQYYALALKK